MKIEQNNGPCQWAAYIKSSSVFKTIEDKNIKLVLSHIKAKINVLYTLAYLANLTTDEDCRRLGHGNKALSEFESKALNHGCKILIARAEDCYTHDEVLCSFYENSGWRIVKRKPPANMVAYKVIGN